MQYEKEIILKDGAKCLLRGAGEADAAEVLRTFDLTHAETDYFLTYPEENSFTVQEEAKFLKARSESKNAIEIAAFVDARIAGTAGIDPIDDKEKIRHRADFGIAIEKAYWGRGIGKALTLACIECAKQAGYYNPVWGRFINADGYASTGQGFTGYNMFAYCNGNPLRYRDSSGMLPRNTMTMMTDTGGGKIAFLTMFIQTKQY